MYPFRGANTFKRHCVDQITIIIIILIASMCFFQTPMGWICLQSQFMSLVMPSVWSIPQLWNPSWGHTTKVLWETRWNTTYPMRIKSVSGSSMVKRHLHSLCLRVCVKGHYWLQWGRLLINENMDGVNWNSLWYMTLSYHSLQ